MLNLEPSEVLQLIVAIRKGDRGVVDVLGHIMNIHLSTEDLRGFYDAIGERLETFDFTDQESFKEIADLPAVRKVIAAATTPVWRTVCCPFCISVQRVSTREANPNCVSCHASLKSWLAGRRREERRVESETSDLEQATKGSQ